MRVAALVLAIVGGFIGLPAAVCSGACAAGLTAVNEMNVDSDGNVTNEDAAGEKASEAGNVFMFLGLGGSLLAIIGGVCAVKPGHLATILLLLALIGNGLTLITFNPLSLMVVVFILLATIFCAVGKVKGAPAPEAA